MKKTIKSIFALAFMANVSANAQNLMVGLQACYQLDNNATNGAYTGATLNGTAVGVTGTTDRFGNANGAYAFSGTNGSYVRFKVEILFIHKLIQIAHSSRLNFVFHKTCPAQ